MQIQMFFLLDEFKGHSLLQAAREADVTRIKKHLSLEMVNFKHPQTHETALVMYFLKKFLTTINQKCKTNHCVPSQG